MNYTIEYEKEEDGRWLAEVMELPGVVAYGRTEEEAISRVEALALRVLAERLEKFAFHDHEEVGPRMLSRLSRHTGLQPHDL